MPPAFSMRANGIVDGYVRPVAWRGSKMMGVSAQDTKIHLAIAVWPWPSYFSPEARKGIKLENVTMAAASAKQHLSRQRQPDYI